MFTTTIVARCKTALSVTFFGGERGYMVSPLTKCCEAAETGAGTAIVCKGCYKPVADFYGWSATSFDEVALLLGEAGCPCPEDCASDVLWKAEEDADEAEARALL